MATFDKVTLGWHNGRTMRNFSDQVDSRRARNAALETRLCEQAAVITGLSTRIRELEAVIAALESQLQQRDQAIARLQEQVHQLQEQLASAKRAGRRQATPFARKKRVSKPKRPGRKKGKGKFSYRRKPAPEEVAETREALLECCPDCGGALTDRQEHEQYVVDIPPVEPVITRYVTHSGYCSHCRRRVRSRHPEQISEATGAIDPHPGLPGRVAAGLEGPAITGAPKKSRFPPIRSTGHLVRFHFLQSAYLCRFLWNRFPLDAKQVQLSYHERL